MNAKTNIVIPLIVILITTAQAVEHLNVNLESKRYFVFLTHSQTLFEHTFSPCLLNVHTGQ